MEVEAKDLQPVTPKIPHLSVKLRMTVNGTGLELGDAGCEIQLSPSPLGHLEQGKVPQFPLL